MPLRRALRRPDRRRRLRRRRAGDPARGRAARPRGALLEANAPQVRLPRVGRREFPNVRVVRGRAEEQEVDEYGVAVAKALAPPPVAAEWCLPLVAAGRRCDPARRPDAPTRRRSRGSSTQLGGGEPERASRACSSSPSSSRRRPAFRAAPGWREEAPARLAGGSRPPAKKECSGARAGLRGREPEGRGRQDDDRRQPRRLPRRGGRAGARRRPRPAGERDLRARRARERHVELRPARRRAARGAREADAVREPLARARRSPSSPAPRSSSRGARTASASWPSRWRAPARATPSSSSTARRRSAR